MKIVVFTGAGVSADSGIPTYRSSDGLWANYKIEEVCTPEALAADRAKVINFYNMRRREMAGKSPNAGHKALVELEQYFDVEIALRLFHESAFKLTYRNMFKQYSIHSLIGIFLESKIVPVVGLKYLPHLHLYLLIPIESKPLHTKSSELQYGHFAGIYEFIMSASPASANLGCRSS